MLGTWGRENARGIMIDYMSHVYSYFTVHTFCNRHLTPPYCISVCLQCVPFETQSNNGMRIEDVLARFMLPFLRRKIIMNV